jgi:2-amino-4-hydroxy-6-hydroxymethyldihydropteridine diphosphokinase
MKKSELDKAVVIALGSNLEGPFGSTRDLLEAALARFADEGLRVTAQSAWWHSTAWPDPGEPAFVNGVVLVETDLDPHETLAALHRIERGFGRDRSRRNASRTLDLDLIAYGRSVLEKSGLTLPHPRATERLFVMGPLAEIAPDWRLPMTAERADRLAERCQVGLDAHPLASAR